MRPVLLAVLVLALPAAVLGLEDPSSPRAIAARKEALAKSIAELGALAASLEELAKTYPTSPDLEATSSARDIVRRQFIDRFNAAWEANRGFDALVKDLESRQQAQVLSDVAGLRRKGLAGRRRLASKAAARSGDKALELVDLKMSFVDSKHKLIALQGRLAVDDEAFARQREARAEVRRLRRDIAAVLAVVLLASAAAVWRLRRRA